MAEREDAVRQQHRQLIQHIDDALIWGSDERRRVQWRSFINSAHRGNVDQQIVEQGPKWGQAV